MPKKKLTDRTVKALKAAPAGKRLLVHDTEVSGFAVRVTDDGRGVSEEDFRGLTAVRRFRGDEAQNRRPGAPGLGIAVAREVADRFGLQLELRRPREGGFEAVILTR